MREYSSNSHSTDVIYKDVVVIGNGPSGISLSYMLSGNWAYFKSDRIEHPDEFLNARINYSAPNKSLMQQDLFYLADGLEGRSNNPVSLLLDNLQKPCADIGLELPSMVEWKYHHDKQIDHIVLGKGKPGGSWHSMDQHILTLSLGNWMSLPGYEFSTWEDSVLSWNKDICLQNEENTPPNTPNRDFKSFTNGQRYQSKKNVNGEKLNDIQKVSKARAPVWKVAKYYEYYVKHMGLTRFFRNNFCVTDIRPISHADKANCHASSCIASALWYVSGYDMLNFQPMQYICRNLVLAAGATDLPNSLGIPGELTLKNRDWLLHDISEFEKNLERISDENIKDIAPVLIVGAGLSSADAIIAARLRGIPVIHVFRHAFSTTDKQLPENMYPEYHKIHQMMRESSASYPLYTALPEHTLTSVSTNAFKPKNFYRSNTPGSTIREHTVHVLNLKTNETKELKVSYCAILIGSRPDLRFLSETFIKPELETNKEHIFGERVNDIELGLNLKQMNIKTNNKRNFLKLNITDSTFCRYCRKLQKRKSNSEIHDSMEASDQYDQGGLGLGININKPIDCRSNPIDVDKFKNNVTNAPPGLYAMGPLVGDNFVRFIPGGALAIVSDLHRKNKKTQNCINNETDTVT